MLVLKSREQIVRISVPGLAQVSRVTVEECKQALEMFRNPDNDSTSKAHEGRKIKDLPDGGWLVLNGAAYSKMLSYEERKEYQRVKQAEYRKRKKGVEDEAKKDGATTAVTEGLSAFDSEQQEKEHTQEQVTAQYPKPEPTPTVLESPPLEPPKPKGFNKIHLGEPSTSKIPDNMPGGFPQR